MPQHDRTVAVLGVDPEIVLVGQRFGRPRCWAITSRQPTLGGSEARGVARWVPSTDAAFRLPPQKRNEAVGRSLYPFAVNNLRASQFVIALLRFRSENYDHLDGTLVPRPVRPRNRERQRHLPASRRTDPQPRRGIEAGDKTPLSAAALVQV